VGELTAPAIDERCVIMMDAERIERVSQEDGNEKDVSIHVNLKGETNGKLENST
jgi:hypothetical protein